MKQEKKQPKTDYSFLEKTHHHPKEETFWRADRINRFRCGY